MKTTYIYGFSSEGPPQSTWKFKHKQKAIVIELEDELWGCQSDDTEREISERKETKGKCYNLYITFTQLLSWPWNTNMHGRFQGDQVSSSWKAERAHQTSAATTGKTEFGVIEFHQLTREGKTGLFTETSTGPHLCWKDHDPGLRDSPCTKGAAEQTHHNVNKAIN